MTYIHDNNYVLIMIDFESFYFYRIVMRIIR